MKITLIGGGTGSSAVLEGIKKNKKLDINVIVTMMDDGGSNNVIREVFGLLPVSDIRKSILALSNSNDEKLREILEYRFSKGKNLKGHTVGNLVLVALSQILKSEELSISELSEVMEVKGNIIPVTKQMSKLIAKYTDGQVRTGEHSIDEPENHTDEIITEIYTTPIVQANPKAIKAILDAEYIILGPGDIYTTTIPNFLVEGVKEAVQASKAKMIYISNLMTKRGQTRHLTAKGLVGEIVRYTDKTPDFVIINNSQISTKNLEKYGNEGDFPIPDDLNNSLPYVVMREDILNNKEVVQQEGDTLLRSLIRHDSFKLANVLKDIFEKNV